ncbi:MAG TPA: MFS transporter [Planctomycetota bacterium]|nr:MFS transporter [Planctomycetota bacterium]
MGFHPTYLQVFLVVALPLMGLVYALLGGVKLALTERLGLDEAKVGRLVSGFGMMVGPTILACGFLTDSIGRKNVFLAGAAMVAAAIFILASTRTFGGAQVAVLLLGAGWSATINVANVLMRVSIQDPTRLVGAINFYDCIFGLGAFLTPMALGLLLRKFRFRGGLFLIAGLSLLPLVLGLFAEMNPDRAAAPATGTPPAAGGLSALLGSAAFWIPALAFLFYAPLETSIAGWATTIVTGDAAAGEEGDRVRKLAASSLSGFWLCFTGSRLLVSLLSTRIRLNEQGLLLGLSLCCLVLMGVVALTRSRGASAAAVVLSGLAVGPVFPTLMTALLKGVPPSLMGRAVGFFFAFASVGWTVIPMLIGAVTRRSDIRKGFLVAAGSGAVFVVLVIVRGLSAS